MTAPACAACGTANRAGARFCRSCGAALTASDPTAPDPFVAPGPADAEREHRRLVRRLLVIGIAVVALVAVYGAFTTIRDTLYTPDRPVRALFAALAERDEAALDEVLACSSALCRGGALQSGYRPPENFEVVKVETLSYTPDEPTRRPDNNTANVSVRYTLDGVAYTDEVRVQRTGGGLLRDWQVTGPPGSDVDVVSLTMPKVRLAGAEIDTTPPPISGFKEPEVPFALPGVYELKPVDDPLVTAENATVVVGGTSTRRLRVDLKVSIRPDAAAVVDKQVRARIDSCISRQDFRPTGGCYFDHNTKYTYTDQIHWSLVDYPKVELRLTEDQSTGKGGVSVRTTTPGHATITYNYSFDILEPRQWSPTSATEEITPRGDVIVTDGAITWSG